MNVDDIYNHPDIKNLLDESNYTARGDDWVKLLISTVLRVQRGSHLDRLRQTQTVERVDGWKI